MRDGWDLLSEIFIETYKEGVLNVSSDKNKHMIIRCIDCFMERGDTAGEQLAEIKSGLMGKDSNREQSVSEKVLSR